MTFKQHLVEIDACRESIKWLGKRTAQQAWDECERPDWLLWWIAKDKPDCKCDIVRLTCKIARTVLRYVPAGEESPRLAIEAAERWAADPSYENANAAYAAYAAAYAAAAYASNAAAKQDYCAIIREHFSCPWKEDE